jgi:predicted lipoprotein with Yx(FWY)xxD motif
VISHALARPTTQRLMLGVLALVAAASIVGRSAEARAGARATSVISASAALTVRSTRFGRILFDGSGRALYAFTRDRRGGRSRCYGACAKAWPVYFAKGRLLGARASGTRSSARAGGATVGCRSPTTAGRSTTTLGIRSPARFSARTSTSSGAPGWSCARPVSSCGSRPVALTRPRPCGEGSPLSASSLLRVGTSSR